MRNAVYVASVVLWSFVVPAAVGQARAAPDRGGQVSAMRPAPAVDARVPPLQRPVTVRLEDVPLVEAIRAIDRQADLRLGYTERIIPPARRVSLTAEGMPAGKALAAVLEGTGLEVKETPDGALTLVRRESRTSADTTRGTIIGRVVDSATAQPVAGVEVFLRNTSYRTTTNERGLFSFAPVPAGAYTLVARLLGYRPVAQVVTVTDSTPIRVDVALGPMPTRLTEIVTTATGERRRFELGHDITVIRADSIVATQPVTSVTDLLEGRVPGMVIQRTSGAPGDPARIRLRGNSSPLLSNDPIVIVDGIRVYAEQSSERGANLASAAYAAPSPLDYLDPHSIETIEVVKGPSAATLYGQDAANGVLVITTKRGRAGPARWTMSAEHGRTEVPGKFPELLARWGHSYLDNAAVLCPINDHVNGAPDRTMCQADSVVAFQLLNDPDLTVLERGHRTGVTLGVSGGSEALTYSVTGSYRDEVGLVQLPTYEMDRYRTLQGSAPPEWMRRPQHLTQWSASSQLTARPGRTADVSLSTRLTRTEQQRSQLEQQLGALMSTYLDRATGTYYRASSGYLFVMPVDEDEVLVDYFERATANATQFTNGVSLNWRPLGWLTATADAGLDVIQRADETFLPRGLLSGVRAGGRVRLGHGTSVLSTVNLRATAEMPLGRGFQFRLSSGVNYTGRSVNDVTAEALGIAEGTESPNGAEEIRSFRQRETDVATFGWYVEPTISHRRFWLSTGLRLDGGSTFGSGVKLPSFPKLSFSYLVSDEPFFPKALRGVFNTLRLRLAYGHAGQPPGPTDRLRLYGPKTATWVGSGFVDGVTLQTLGNTQLKPERTKELEGGFDADLLDDRLRLSVTAYRKTTTDALLEVPVAPSVYRDAKIKKNIGVVRNTGLEAEFDAQLVRSDALTWGLQASFSQHRDEVVELGPGVEPFYTESPNINKPSGVRVVPGYPLPSRWTKPIVGYADANGNGVLEQDELVLGDTLVYVGAMLPNYTLHLNTSLSLLRGTVSVTAGFLYEDGLTQRNEVAQKLAPFSRAWNDPSASLAEQAAVANVTEFNWFQTVNAFRFNSLSVAYNLPAGLARRFFGARALSILLQGSNLGLWTNYRGLDPNVNAHATGNSVTDTGVLPRPRTWQVRVNATY